MAGPPPQQKLCPSCGTSLPVDANICSTCGHNFNTGPYVQPPGPPTGPFPPPGAAGPPRYANPNWQANYPRSGYEQQTTGAADGLGIASLILGIISLPLFCIWCLGIPCALLALVFGGFGLNGRYRSLAIAGMICAGFGILLAILILVFIQTANFGPRHPNPFG